jgi:hypothetical protein
MAASSRIFALLWYARGDYPALLKLFSDSNCCRQLSALGLSVPNWLSGIISESRFQCRQDLDSSSSLRSLVQGAERFPRSSGAPDLRE